MNIFAIADLHLARSIDKPMDVFGGDWQDYMERISRNWRMTVGEDDCVIVPGDISWATYLEEVYEDFSFLDSLPGRKILSKGNHDYWWTSMKKLENYVKHNGFSTIDFLHNNSYIFNNVCICGSRGWKCPGDDTFDSTDMRIYERELKRLELSLGNAGNTRAETVIAALHFPPFNRTGEASGFIDIMIKYSVDICIYGHLHGRGAANAVTGVFKGTDFKFVAADHIGFEPMRII